MCTATLSHAGPVLGGALGMAMLEEAAHRLVAVFESGQRDATGDGLLWHGFDVVSGAHSCCKWGDGNGWMLMAMADAIKGYRELAAGATQLSRRLVTAFEALAGAWLQLQRPSGLWTQLVDDATTYESSSATGFALYSLATGVRLGVLTDPRYPAAIEQGWRGLGTNIQPDGSVAGLSPGFGILGSRAEYLVKTNSSLLWGYGAVLRACAAILQLN